MKQEHGIFQSAAKTTVVYWSVGTVTLLLNVDGDLTYCPEHGDAYGVSSLTAGLRLLGWTGPVLPNGCFRGMNSRQQLLCGRAMNEQNAAVQ